MLHKEMKSRPTIEEILEHDFIRDSTQYSTQSQNDIPDAKSLYKESQDRINSITELTDANNTTQFIFKQGVKKSVTVKIQVPENPDEKT